MGPRRFPFSQLSPGYGPGGVPVEPPTQCAPGAVDPAGVTDIPPVTLAGRGDAGGAL